MVRRPASLAAAAAGAVAAVALAVAGTPAGVASAAPSLSTPLGCWIDTAATHEFPVTGAGFPALSDVVVGYSTGWPQTDVTTSTTGAFSAELVATTTSMVGEPRTVTVQGDEFGNDSIEAGFTIPLVYQGGGVATPSGYLDGQLASQPTPWEFGGYPGAAMFAHFSYSDYSSGPYHLVATTRFGSTTGPCGTLRVARALFQGIKVRAGWWQVDFDSSPSYHRPPKRSLIWCGSAWRVRVGVRAGTVIVPRHAYVELSPCMAN